MACSKGDMDIYQEEFLQTTSYLQKSSLLLEKTSKLLKKQLVSASCSFIIIGAAERAALSDGW